MNEECCWHPDETLHNFLHIQSENKAILLMWKKVGLLMGSGCSECIATKLKTKTWTTQVTVVWLVCSLRVNRKCWGRSWFFLCSVWTRSQSLSLNFQPASVHLPATLAAFRWLIPAKNCRTHSVCVHVTTHTFFDNTHSLLIPRKSFLSETVYCCACVFECLSVPACAQQHVCIFPESQWAQRV